MIRNAEAPTAADRRGKRERMSQRRLHRPPTRILVAAVGIAAAVGGALWHLNASPASTGAGSVETTPVAHTVEDTAEFAVPTTFDQATEDAASEDTTAEEPEELPRKSPLASAHLVRGTLRSLRLGLVPSDFKIRFTALGRTTRRFWVPIGSDLRFECRPDVQAGLFELFTLGSGKRLRLDTRDWRRGMRWIAFDLRDFNPPVRKDCVIELYYLSSRIAKPNESLDGKISLRLFDVEADDELANAASKWSREGKSRFVLSRLPLGSYRLVLTDRRRDRRWLLGSYEHQGQSTIAMRLEISPPLVWEVLDANGKLRQSTTELYVRDVHGDVVWHKEKKGGAFSIRGLRPGRYSLWVHGGKRGVDIKEAVRVYPDDAPRGQSQLKDGVRVFIEWRRPMPAYQLTWISRKRARLRQRFGRSQATPRRMFTILPRGSWTLRVLTPKGPMQRRVQIERDNQRVRFLPEDK